ncbi:MAG TPA: GNAT family protein [Paludibacter sp.]|nr:GNAT family protein [Paludibacter sp.]
MKMNDSIRLYVDEDVLLKEIGLEDVEDIFDTIDFEREYLSEWLPFVELTTDISYTRTFIKNYLNSEIKDLTFVIHYKNKFVGLVGFKDTDSDNMKTEIGYWLSESYQHKGIITRSCKKLIEYAFDELKMNRIQLKAATGNIKSQAVAERLGFTREGIERQGELHTRGFVDLVVFGLLKQDWLIGS